VVPVWIRDAWAETESTIQTDAVKAGSESATVFVLLPNRDADEIRKAIVTLKAAEITLQTKGVPSNEEGKLARAAVETRRDQARTRLGGLLAEVIDNAQVIQAGGNEVTAGTVPDAVKGAVDNALVRLFPKFSTGDHSKWGATKEKARVGDGAALKVIGWEGDADKHPLALEMLGYCAADRLGAEVRKQFEGPPYGWPGDAVDALVYVLTATEHLRAFGGSGEQLALSALDSKKIGLSKFRAETVPLTVHERIGLQVLMQKVQIACKKGDEAASAPALVAELKRRAAVAGGDPPAPAAPSTAHLLALDALAGNALVKKLYEAREPLTADIDTWDTIRKAIEGRKPRWETLEALLTVSATLPVAAEVGTQRDALVAGRSLLIEPDPIPHLCAQITSELRAALVTARDRWRAVYDVELPALEATPAWQKLPPETRKSLTIKHGIDQVPGLTVGTEAEVLVSAKSRSLTQWGLDEAGLPGRFASARLEAIQLTTPTAQKISLPKATLHDAAEVDTWLAEARAAILAKLNGGPVVV